MEEQGDDDLLRFDPRALSTGVADRYQIVPLRLEDPMVNVTRALVDSREFPHLRFASGSAPMIDGVKVTITIPFTGGVELWQLEPSRTSTAQITAEVGLHQIVVSKNWHDMPTTEVTRTWVDEVMNELHQCVAWQSGDINEYNQSLEPAAFASIEKRRKSLLAINALQRSLPFRMATRGMMPL